MKRCVMACWLVAALSIGGCGWLESFYEKPKDGGSSTAEKVQSIARGLPYGWIVDAAIGLGGTILGGGTVHAHHTRKKRRTATPPAPPAAPAA